VDDEPIVLYDTSRPFDLAVQWPVLIIGVALLVLLAMIVVALSTLKNVRAPLAFVVGVTAGLQTAQIASVHMFCPAVALWLVFGVWRERRQRMHPQWAVAVVGCAALLATTAFTGQMVNYKLVAIQLMLLASTAACLIAFGERSDVRPALLGLLTITTIACLAALAQYVGVLPYKVFLGTHRPIGLYVEPDWLGMFAAVGLVLAFRIVFSRWRMPLVFLHVLVLVLAQARAAWGAVVLVALLGWVVVRVVQRERPREVVARGGGLKMAIGAVVLLSVALVASPTLQESLVDRVTGAVGAKPEVGAMARQQQNSALLELESQAPVTGLGLSASGRVGVSGRIAYIGTSRNNVASNWLLGWWVDGGVLAVPLILLFFFAAGRRFTTTNGLLLSTVLICSFLSNAMVIPIAWFTLALCLMHLGSEEKEKEKATVRPVLNGHGGEVRVALPRRRERSLAAGGT
jgi:hypothetical protein